MGGGRGGEGKGGDKVTGIAMMPGLIHSLDGIGSKKDRRWTKCPRPFLILRYGDDIESASQ